MVKKINIRSYAKINLSLDVLRRREDGYHDLKMIMHSVNLYDKISITAHKKGGITLRTNLPYLPVNEKNHVYRAAQLFFAHTNLRCEGLFIQIQKHIPVSAGLAGGSSNAAAALKGLNYMYGAGLSNAVLAELGKQVGADVPYCIYGGTMLAEGIGEQLTPLPRMPRMPIVLAKPPVNLSTPAVFQALSVASIRLHPDTKGMIEALRIQDSEGVARRMYNVLEDPAQVVMKQMGTGDLVSGLKHSMLDYGALGTLMSGSGPTVFGLFDREEKAKSAAKAALRLTKDVFVTTT